MRLFCQAKVKDGHDWIDREIGVPPLFFVDFGELTSFCMR
jgi:hypothetical protein